MTQEAFSSFPNRPNFALGTAQSESIRGHHPRLAPPSRDILVGDFLLLSVSRWIRRTHKSGVSCSYPLDIQREQDVKIILRRNKAHEYFHIYTGFIKHG